MDHYHVGIVVTDIDAASTKLSELLGITWGPIMHLDAVEYRDEKGDDVVLPTTMRYSTGTPCLELILEVPGSVWVRNESSNLHHIGFWSDSLSDQSGAFSAAGCPCSCVDGPAARHRRRSPTTAMTSSGSAWNSSTHPCATQCSSSSSPSRPATDESVFPGSEPFSGRPGFTGAAQLALARPRCRQDMLSLQLKRHREPPCTPGPSRCRPGSP